MVTGSNDVDEIYHRMAVIRRELHTNVSESVAGAEAVIDWGRYTWTYPWIVLGAAAAVGYLVYTGGHQGVTAETESLTDGAEAREPVAGADASGQERSRIGRNLLFAAWGLFYPVAIRAAQNDMLHWFEQRYRTSPVDRAALFSPPSGSGPAGWSGRKPSRSSGSDRNRVLGGQDDE